MHDTGVDPLAVRRKSTAEAELTREAAKVAVVRIREE